MRFSGYSRPLEIPGPNRGAQSKDTVVRLRDSLIQIFNSDNGEGRPENFFLNHLR